MSRNDEYLIQTNLAEYMTLQYPRTLFHSDMSGIRLTIGQAVKVKKIQGGRAFPDWQILEARGGYIGFLLELKTSRDEVYTKSGEMRQGRSYQHIHEQADMLAHLYGLGYWADWGFGFDDARQKVDWYLAQQPTKIFKVGSGKLIG